jgi:hypothetical protein
MAASEAILANLALRSIGDQTEITDLATDTRAAAKRIREYLETAIEETLKARNWSFARVVANLVQIADLSTTADRLEEWQYVYRLPENCLQPWRLLRGWRNAPNDQQIRFERRLSPYDAAWDEEETYDLGDYASLEADGATVWYRALAESTGESPDAVDSEFWEAIEGVPPMVIYTTQNVARLEYTRIITDIRFFPKDVDNAVGARIGFYIAPTIAKGNKDAAKDAAAQWDFLIRQAEAQDGNAAQIDPDPPSSFELARIEGDLD